MVHFNPFRAGARIYPRTFYVANDDARIYPQIAPEHKVREPPRVNNHREELSCQSTLLWCQY